MDRDHGDDVIMTSSNRVRPQTHVIIHIKFGEDRMKNTQVIMLRAKNKLEPEPFGAAQPLGSVLHGDITNQRGDDVIMTSCLSL